MSYRSLFVLQQQALTARIKTIQIWDSQTKGTYRSGEPKCNKANMKKHKRILQRAHKLADKLESKYALVNK